MLNIAPKLTSSASALPTYVTPNELQAHGFAVRVILLAPHREVTDLWPYKFTRFVRPKRAILRNVVWGMLDTETTGLRMEEYKQPRPPVPLLKVSAYSIPRSIHPFQHARTQIAFFASTSFSIFYFIDDHDVLQVPHRI